MERGKYELKGTKRGETLREKLKKKKYIGEAGEEDSERRKECG